MIVKFDIETALKVAKGERKGRILTRKNNEEVRLLCTDAYGIYPVIGLIRIGERDMPYAWTSEGRYDYHPTSYRPRDLVIDLD